MVRLDYFTSKLQLQIASSQKENSFRNLHKEGVHHAVSQFRHTSNFPNIEFTIRNLHWYVCESFSSQNSLPFEKVPEEVKNSGKLWTITFYTYTLPRHNIENSKKIFPEKELRGLRPISTYICQWAIYTVYCISRWSVCLFCCGKICGPILGIYKSLSETWIWNWDWGRAFPFLETHKWDIRCSVENSKSERHLVD